MRTQNKFAPKNSSIERTGLGAWLRASGRRARTAIINHKVSSLLIIFCVYFHHNGQHLPRGRVTGCGNVSVVLLPLQDYKRIEKENWWPRPPPACIWQSFLITRQFPSTINSSFRFFAAAGGGGTGTADTVRACGWIGKNRDKNVKHNESIN